MKTQITHGIMHRTRGKYFLMNCYRNQSQKLLQRNLYTRYLTCQSVSSSSNIVLNILRQLRTPKLETPVG